MFVDIADDPSFTRQSKHCYIFLYQRGRHNKISAITATQNIATHPIIRLNATELYMYRLMNKNGFGSYYK